MPQHTSDPWWQLWHHVGFPSLLQTQPRGRTVDAPQPGEEPKCNTCNISLQKKKLFIAFLFIWRAENLPLLFWHPALWRRNFLLQSHHLDKGWHCRRETVGYFVGVLMKEDVVFCVSVCLPVISVCVCGRFLYALVHLRDEETVVHMNSMTEVLSVLLFLCVNTRTEHLYATRIISQDFCFIDTMESFL